MMYVHDINLISHLSQNYYIFFKMSASFVYYKYSFRYIKYTKQHFVCNRASKFTEAWGLYKQWSRRACYYMDKCSGVTEAGQKQSQGHGFQNMLKQPYLGGLGKRKGLFIHRKNTDLLILHKIECVYSDSDKLLLLCYLPIRYFKFIKKPWSVHRHV